MKRAAGTLIASLLLAGACSDSSLPHRTTAADSEASAETDTITVLPFVSPTPVPALGPASPPCEQATLSAAARGPVGATAMMSLTIVVANTGSARCSLYRPDVVRMLSSDGLELANFKADPARLLPYVDLVPTRAPNPDEASGPGGAGYLWLVWTWRSESACHPLDPPEVTLLVEFPGGTRLEAPGSVAFAPCSKIESVSGFGVLPPG